MSSRLVCILLFCLSAGSAAGHGVKTRTIEIVHPWTFGSSTAGGDVEVCFKIKNSGRLPDRLIGARTPLAATITIVEPDAGSTTATRAIKAIDVAAGGQVALQLGERRLQLARFSRATSAWELFPLTLVFERAGPITVEVLVEEK